MSFATTSLENMTGEERETFWSVCDVVLQSVMHTPWALRTPAMIGARLHAAAEVLASDAGWLPETIHCMNLRFTVRDGWRSGLLDAALSWCLASGALTTTPAGYRVHPTRRAVSGGRLHVLNAAERAAFRFAAPVATELVDGGSEVSA